MNWYKKILKFCSGDAGWSCVRLNKKISDKIISWGKKNIPDDIIYKKPFDGSFGREEDIHITVRYGILDTDHDKVKELLKDIEPIKATLKDTGFFQPEDDYDVVIIKVESNDLKKINKLIEKSLNVTKNTHGAYKAHCTIAYVEKGEAKKYAGDKTFNGEKLVFNEIYFEDKNNKETKIKLKKK